MTHEEAVTHVAIANLSINAWLRTGTLIVRIEGCGTRARIDYDPHAEFGMIAQPISGAPFPIDESCEKFIEKCYEQICTLL